MQQISVAVLTILEISSIVRLESAGIPFCRNVTPEDDLQNEVDYNAVAIDNSTDVPSHQNYEEPIESDPGHPLFLTPYIKSGQLQVARNLSYVGALDGIKTNSYSGYLTVNQEYESNLFFWFFPVEKNDSEVPLLLWLQGGPGMSALFGVFVEHGPFFVTKNGKLRSRSSHWAQLVNMLYIDNPVGTGFSFTKDERGYAENQEDVAGNLYEALQQFFTLFPEYQDNEFHIAGESYGGKFATSLGHTISRANKESNNTNAMIKLTGILLGNSLLDWKQFVGSERLFYNMGFIDKETRDDIEQRTKTVQFYVARGQWIKALVENMNIILHPSALFLNVTGLLHAYDLLRDMLPDDFFSYTRYIGANYVKKALHVGNGTFRMNHVLVPKHLLEDYAKSVAPMMTELLDDGCRILAYHGQMDLLVPFVGTHEFLLSLEWSGAQGFRDCSRTNWNLENRDGSNVVGGYARSYGGLTEVLIRNAGHFAPFDKPKFMLMLLKRHFVRGSGNININLIERVLGSN